MTRHALPWLGSPIEVEVPWICTVCGYEAGHTCRYHPTRMAAPRADPVQPPPTTERRNGHIWRFDERSVASLNYPGVLAQGRALFPMHEGRLSDATMVDRHGEPDLMAKFAMEYLKQYRAIMPKGRLPLAVSEMMPALHLLVTAAELALKAYLIRSHARSRGHDLRTLYMRLRPEHRDELESRFADTGPNMDLNVLGVERATMESILSVYDTVAGGSTAYRETRYFAEPTTELRAGLKGANLIKDTPYRSSCRSPSRC